MDDAVRPPVAPRDARRLVSGLVCAVTRPGRDDERPGPDDRVEVSYRVWTGPGRLITDSGGAVELSVTDLGPGVAEALQLVGVGGQLQAWVPARLTREPADGDRTYEVDLVRITLRHAPRQVPLHLRSPGLDEPPPG